MTLHGNTKLQCIHPKGLYAVLGKQGIFNDKRESTCKKVSGEKKEKLTQP